MLVPEDGGPIVFMELARRYLPLQRPVRAPPPHRSSALSGDLDAAIAEANRDVVVVTADRELAERVRAADAEVVGPSWLLEQLVN